MRQAFAGAGSRTRSAGAWAAAQEATAVSTAAASLESCLFMVGSTRDAIALTWRAKSAAPRAAWPRASSVTVRSAAAVAQCGARMRRAAQRSRVGRMWAQSMSSSKPPRARTPCSAPCGQAVGSAGSRWISPPQDCTSISRMPAAPPKLPSIWNGGCASNMLG